MIEIIAKLAIVAFILVQIAGGVMLVAWGLQ